MRRLSILALALVLSALPATAQVVGACEGWVANARNLMMPPEVSVQTFANGEVRVIGLDTSEPACCSAHLMVDYFVESEPFPLCALISAGTGGNGFSGLRMEDLSTTYDPVEGLVLTLPAGRHDNATGGSVMSPLRVVINRATATVTARHD